MWNTILGAVALASFGFEVTANKEARNASTSESDEFKLSEVKEDENGNQIPRQFKPGKKQRKRALLSNNAKPKKDKEKEHKKDSDTDIDPVKEWIISHDYLILSVLETGTHKISLADLKGVDIEKVADFIFALNGVDSVDIVTDGLEIVTR